jgi:ABC-type enterochelin transport system permease subunit
LLHWTQGSVTTLIQGHWSKVKVTICIVVFDIVRAITFHRVYELEYFTELLHWIKGSVTALIQDHWSNVKVTAHNGQDIGK